MPRSSRPAVSIGIPVYNGERYLKGALDSLLAQTFSDFEIVISDNASTDSTEAICRAYADRDARIRYHRNATNLGHTINTNQIVHMCRGEYYRQHHDDDLMAPECLKACVNALDARPDAVLVHTHTKTIDETGSVIFGNEPVNYVLDDPRPHVRYEKYMRQVFPHLPEHALLNICFALVRRDVLATTTLEGAYPHADRMMYGGLALYGAFAIVPEPLFLRRDHPNRSNRKMEDERVLSAWQATSNANRLLFMPRTQAFFDAVRWIRRAPISLAEKARCLRVVYDHYLRHFGANIVHYEPRAELSRLIKGYFAVST